MEVFGSPTLLHVECLGLQACGIAITTPFMGCWELNQDHWCARLALYSLCYISRVIHFSKVTFLLLSPFFFAVFFPSLLLFPLSVFRLFFGPGILKSLISMTLGPDSFCIKGRRWTILRIVEYSVTFLVPPFTNQYLSPAVTTTIISGHCGICEWKTKTASIWNLLAVVFLETFRLY